MQTEDPILDPVWTVEPVGLEDVVLAYMGHTAAENRDPRLVSVVPS